MEIWKKVNGFEHISVSDQGRLRNDMSGRIYKTPQDAYGYLVWCAPNKKVYKVHRLVAMAFPEICGEYEDGLVVDHINTIRDDNRAENLQWCSSKENNNNPLTRQKISEYMRMNNPMKNPDAARRSSDTRTGMKLSEETKKKMSDGHKGMHPTDEVRKKMSESQQLRWNKIKYGRI